MTIILFILGIGAAIFILSLIIMWYVMVISVMIVGAIAVAAYWLAFMLLDGVVPNPEAWAISAAVAVFIGIGYLGVTSDKIGKKNGS